MAQRGSGYRRKALDRYFTPAWPVASLVAAWPRLPRHAVEPCAGAGHICAALEQLGFSIASASDLEPYRGKRAWDGEISRLDLFMGDPPQLAPRPGRLWITNPPFGAGGHLAAKVARALIVRALSRSGDVALLLPATFDSGSTRADLFSGNRKFAGKLVLTDRIRWANVRQKRNGPSSDHAWFIWAAQHNGPPVVRYACRADGEALLAAREAA